MVYLSLPRILRVIAGLAVSFLALIVVYIALPSPTVPESIILQKLHSGLSVTRAYRVNNFIPRSQSSHTIKSDEAERFALSWSQKDAFALTWSFHASNHTLLADGVPLFTFTPDHMDIHEEYNQPEVSVVAGNEDGIVFPWFAFADAVLMAEGVEPMPDLYYATLPLRAVRIKAEMQEMVSYAVHVDVGGGDATAPPAILTITYPGPTLHLPPPPLSASPSTTFLVRRTIVRLLAPQVLFMVRFASVIALAAKLACGAGVVWLCWALGRGSLLLRWGRDAGGNAREDEQEKEVSEVADTRKVENSVGQSMV